MRNQNRYGTAGMNWCNTMHHDRKTFTIFYHHRPDGQILGFCSKRGFVLL